MYRETEVFDTIVSVLKVQYFLGKIRIGIVSVSKFMSWKVSYQYRYQLFKMESICIGIGVTFFFN